jgi:outer membrane lipoprotein SlyB
MTPMTTYEKSKALWIGGGLLGAIIGYASTKRSKETVLAGLLGSILVGAVGDKVLEQHQRTGRWSLVPIR